MTNPLDKQSLTNKEVGESMTYDFPLRKNLNIQFFNMPRNLTEKEVKRLSKCIKCLAIK